MLFPGSKINFDKFAPLPSLPLKWEKKKKKKKKKKKCVLKRRAVEYEQLELNR